ncbi:MAG: efflux RND transporter periplasmic adaptor subunit [bacterium]|nr:efflux RND transporter periplasmic adaptor subunit [bacterium]
MKKLVMWIVIIALVGLVGFRISEKFKKVKEKPAEVAEPTEVLVEVASYGSIAKTLPYIGNIVGSEQAYVFPVEETGKLIRYVAKEGSMVSKGDTIALIDRNIKGMDFKPAVINAPISGIVGNLNLDPGSMVAPGIPVAMVANINAVKVEINIPENDISYIKTGNKANIKVSSYPNDIFNGQLTKISPVLNPMSRTSQASISIINPGNKLRPGMFANVDVIIEEHTNVIVVPQKALIDNGGRKIVFVLNGEMAEMREVSIGLENNDFVEILTGINSGEQIITLGNYGLTNGAKVKIIK